MHFDSFAAFLEMGGYGFFVWLSYGVSLLVVVAFIIYVKLDKRKLIAEVRAEAARKARIKQAKEQS
ncbi:MAG: heme exporter protein CcmD [Glaciecola sp.]|jgi:heme exporter protein D|nr:heme exporter protein CcmD [Glaciecola sp.]MDG1816349.1 heme exporter protein CcmD [Glaciecola sp.]MDG2100261.1 heme exporter protein CcmD [Glaciecola sp.]